MLFGAVLAGYLAKEHKRTFIVLLFLPFSFCKNDYKSKIFLPVSGFSLSLLMSKIHFLVSLDPTFCLCDIKTAKNIQKSAI